MGEGICICMHGAGSSYVHTEPGVSLSAFKRALVNAHKLVIDPSTLPCIKHVFLHIDICLLYTSPSPRDRTRSRMPSSA